MEIIQLNNKPFKKYISSIEIAESCTKIANQINSDYKNKRPLFLAVLNGSFIFAADLFRKINLPSDISFVKIASYSGTNSTEKINNLIGINENIEGRDIIIIEDIVDTGNTLHYLFEILKEKKANTIQIATLLFKPEAYKWNYPVQYVGKTIPNVFVVGYGLDYDGFGRNLNSIYILNENNMLNIVLFGPPGAGKGTQSEKLVNKYSLIHLSTGDIFRANMKGETDLGKLAKSYMDKGELVPDQVTINMLEAEVNKYPNAMGFIFDGFPRTVPQAEALDKFLAQRNTPLTLMLALEVPEQELINRLLLRGKDSGRTDDQDENIVKNRIKVYNEQTAVAAAFYQKQNKYVAVNGIGSIDEIFQRLCQSIDTKSVTP